MNILVDARPMHPWRGGVPRVAYALMLALAKAMPEHQFIWATAGQYCAQKHADLPQNIKTTHCFLPNKILNGLISADLSSFDARFLSAEAKLLFCPNIGFIGRPRVPYVLLVHDLSFLIEPRWFSRKAQWWHRAIRATRLIREAALLFAVSERTKTDIIKYLHVTTERITVIPLGPTSSFPSSVLLPAPLNNRRFFLLLNAADVRKNSACAMAAFQELIKDPNFSDVLLVTTGSVPQNRNHSALGCPTDEALACLMKYASALLYPSWYEGFGLPLHEAARFSTPCIASTTGAMPETAPKGVFFVPPSKPQLWTEAMKEVLKMPNAYRTIAVHQDWSASAISVKNELQKSFTF